MRNLFPFIPLLWCQTMPAQNLQADLNSTAVSHGLIGMSVVSLCDGQVTDVVHYGKSDLTRDIDVNDSTRYRIASISKLVTAIGLMELYEQGTFGLDDDVSTALGFTLRNPNFPSTPITYRMLLSHTSSIQDGTGYNGFLGATYASAPPPPISDLLTTAGPDYTSDMFRTEAPGSFYIYANINFGIIGTLVEALSGVRFDQYMRNEVLLPLGIEGSFNLQDLTDLDNLAVLYRNSSPQADNYQGMMPPPPNLGAYVPGGNGIYFGPQGGLRVSALELARIAQLILGRGTYSGTTLLQPATVDLMLTDEWTYNGSNGDDYYGLFKSWGLGVHRVTAQAGSDVVFPGLPMFGHAGEAYGLISDMYVDTTGGYGLVFITNGYTPGHAYQFAANSSFYSVEAAVYDALEQYGHVPCTTVGIADAPESDPLSVSHRMVVSRMADELVITAFDALGKEAASTVLHGPGSWTPAVEGPLFVRCCSHGGCRTLKLP